MTLDTHEFIRRFLMHVLPKGFHRIRHYGLLANGNRAANVAKARELLDLHAPSCEPKPADPSPPHPRACPCCGGRMRVIEVFTRGQAPRHWATPTPISIDTS
jgi:Putative transposase